MSSSITTSDLPPWMGPLKRGVRALCRELGSQRRLADVLAVSDTLVQAWHSDDVRKAIPWAHVLDERLHAHLPAGARAAFWRVLVGPGLAVIETQLADGLREADLALASSAMRSSAELTASLLDAVSDGHITRPEGQRILAAVDTLHGILMAIRARAEAAVEGDVVAEVRPIRRGA